VLRESSNMLIELSMLDGRRVNPYPGEESVPSRLDWRPWNEALAMICLVADHEIVEAAQAIDAEFWPVHIQIKNGLTTESEWFALRDLVEASRQDFVNITRKHLAPPGPPLRRLTARPPAGDPIWQPRRS
jgi:hypothetical protein